MDSLKIDLNADLGEGAPHDAELMALISSASIACGGHAGDVDSMRATVLAARAHGVRIGAHPSYPDRAHFGRRSLQITPAKLAIDITAQLWSLKAVCFEAGVSFSYVKPHGALYNDAARDAALADLIAGTIHEIDPGLALMGLAGSELIAAGQRAGLATISEVFADRAYLADGSLMPRDQPGAVLDHEAALAQALTVVNRGGLTAVDGTWLALNADSICVHGDNPHALAFLQLLHARLGAAR
ncbi:hypothetical protein IGB42_03671 [Andreprevotia sp. IGB-42]|uniref:5-oxoprolinase subunit PxpA n=1 Tax=Andreprevotia sp. IGB-42 TaxID=2497473 RepID=UPI00157EEA6B|nr:5-oxoprolinase subunit PxpA [Andreprevotia sp. IGB-42]KAF0811861.1 hypothetical protein IGB42_03671 [Andreprevotia sp. IGB-42]